MHKAHSLLTFYTFGLKSRIKFILANFSFTVVTITEALKWLNVNHSCQWSTLKLSWLLPLCNAISRLWAAIYIFNQLKAAWCVVGEGRLVLVCVKCLSWLVFGRCSHLHCLCPCCGEQRHIFTSNSFPAWPTNSVSFGPFDWSLLSVNVRLAELYIYEDSLICAVEITNPRTHATTAIPGRMWL